MWEKTSDRPSVRLSVTYYFQRLNRTSAFHENLLSQPYFTWSVNELLPPTGRILWPIWLKFGKASSTWSPSAFRSFKNIETMKARLYLRENKKFCPRFLTVHSIRFRKNSVLQVSTKICWVTVGFHEKRCIESHTLITGVNKFLSVLSSYRPIWAKIIWDICKKILFSICDYHDNRRSEGFTFFMSVNNITLNYRLVPVHEHIV